MLSRRGESPTVLLVYFEPKDTPKDSWGIGNLWIKNCSLLHLRLMAAHTSEVLVCGNSARTAFVKVKEVRSEGMFIQLFLFATSDCKCPVLNSCYLKE